MAETITDLTGYTWTGNNTLTTPPFEFSNSVKKFEINWYNSEQPSFHKESLKIYKDLENLLKAYVSLGLISSYTINSGDLKNMFVIDAFYIDPTFLDILYASGNAEGTITVPDGILPAGTYPMTITKGWDTAYTTTPNVINFTGGTDATNTDLITWLQENGTLTKDSSQQLVKPSNVSINTNTYDSWILLVENNNSVAVTCHYTFGSASDTDTIEASTQGRIGGNWTSGQTSVVATMYFSADGYVDSDSITYTLIRPSYLSMNKYRSSNDFTPTMPTDEFTQTLAFTSNNTSFSGMRATTDTLYYVKSDGSEVEVYNTSTKWTGNTEYIAILVSEEQIVAGIFKTFFDTLYKTIDNFEYTLKIKGHETYAIKLNLGGTTYEIK